MISIIIPTYNREQTIGWAIQSVLNQTFQDFELIIVDDCSTDGTAIIVNEILDSRVRYIRHTSNLGACAARNTGIDAARGEYIAFQDSDDRWLPEKLDMQLQAIQKSGADLVFCKYIKKKLGNDPVINPSYYHEGFLDPVVNLFGIGTQTLLGKSEVFKEVHFDVKMPRWQDVELLIRISNRFSIFCMDDALVEHYYMPESISTNPQKLYNACTIMFEKYPNLIKDFPEMGKYMSGTLLLGSETIKNDKNLRRALFKLARQCDPGVKCQLKILKRILLPKRVNGS